MTDTEKRSRVLFAKGMVIYALVLLTIILVGLAVFYFYISAYEYSRPEQALDRYLSNTDVLMQQSEVQELLSSIDPRLQPQEDNAAMLREVFSRLSYAKKVSASTEDNLIYVLKDGSTILGELSLRRTEEKRFNFSPWEVVDAALDLKPLLRESTVTVPSGWTVVCGDCTLGADSVVDAKVPYSFLEEFYGSYTLPYLLCYSSGSYFGEVETWVYAPDGTRYAPEELSEALFEDNCTQTEKDDIDAFVNAYIPCYVTYLSGVNQAHMYNLYAVQALTVPDSDLYTRLNHALGGQGWASSHGDYLQSVTLNRTMKLDSKNYVCDITYLVDTYGQNGSFTTTTNNAKLLLTETKDGLRAYAQISY